MKSLLIEAAQQWLKSSKRIHISMQMSVKNVTKEIILSGLFTERKTYKMGTPHWA